jgi:C-terminal novel E3 ligase, LRR-interacting
LSVAVTICQTQDCGQPVSRVGEDVSERLAIAPAEFFAHRHIDGLHAVRRTAQRGLDKLLPAGRRSPLGEPGRTCFHLALRMPHDCADRGPKTMQTEGSHDSSATVYSPLRAEHIGQEIGIARANSPSVSPESAQAPAVLPPSNVPTGASTLAQTISRLSPVPGARIFRKSASEQYKFAKSLLPDSREHLQRLEQELERQFRQATDARVAKRAMNAWLSVQHAYLRFHMTDQRRSHARAQTSRALFALDPLVTPFALRSMLRERSSYYASAERPEYRAAFNNFMRVIEDESVPDALRQIAEEKLSFHWKSEGTVAFLETQELRKHGVRSLARRGYQVPDVPLAAAVLANQTAEDIGKQRNSLGSEINRWLKVPLQSAHRFDQEPYAQSFARLLHRVRPKLGGLIGVAASKTLVEGENIIRAVAVDADLRAKVFAMAESSLGTCGDLTKEGFANIATLVRCHQMRESVRKGEVDARELRDWAHRQFRLETLAGEVIQRFGRDPELAQVMLYAQVKLAKQLDLPSERPVAMRYGRQRWISRGTLEVIGRSVLAKQGDAEATFRFLCTNETWRSGMQQLHADRFMQLAEQFGNDSFYEMPLPSQVEAHAHMRETYHAAADEMKKRIEAGENDLLRELYVARSEGLADSRGRL